MPVPVATQIRVALGSWRLGVVGWRGGKCNLRGQAHSIVRVRSVLSARKRPVGQTSCGWLTGEAVLTNMQ
jgi:hypothetical protein